MILGISKDDMRGENILLTLSGTKLFQYVWILKDTSNSCKLISPS